MTAASAASTLVRPSRITRQPNRRLGPLNTNLAIVYDPLRAGLFVLMVLTISRVHESYPVLAKLRPALLLVLASVAYAYLKPRFLTRTNVLRVWPMRYVAILAGLACCSAAFGISLGGSASFILDSYAKTLACAFLIAVSIRHARDLFTFVWAYVVGCGVLAFFSIFVFGISKGSNSYVSRLNNLYTYDSNDLGVVMMVGLPLAVLLFSVERGIKRWLLVLIVLGISATMARSGSRGGFLGFLAVGVAALFLIKGISPLRRITVVSGAALALAVAAPPGYWKQMATMLQPSDDYNYYERDGRKAIMERGLGYMRQRPVFGLGIDNFNRAECTISPKLASIGIHEPVKCVSPHNSYIQAGSELGIVGFIVWASLVLGGIVAPLRLRRRLPKSWQRGSAPERFIFAATGFFAIAMVGFGVTSFFVSFAWRDPVYMMSALLTGLYVSTRVQLEEWSRSGRAHVTTASHESKSGWRVTRNARRAGTGTDLRPRAE
jgi:O-antigen ligase